MLRLMLNDEFRSRLEKILFQKTIYNKRNLCMTIEGMLYRMRVGCPWRDLPEALDAGISSTKDSIRGHRVASGAGFSKY